MNARNEYRPVYQTSLVDPAEFWAHAATAVDWEVPPEQVIDTTARPAARWFPDATLNTSFNALDRHVRALPEGSEGTGGRADQPALIYDSAMTGNRGYTPTPSC